MEADTLPNPYENFPGAVIEYDAEGFFVACNTRHKEMFPQCKAYLRHGVARRDIVRAYAANFERSSDWLEARLSTLQEVRQSHDERMPDGRVIRFLESRTPDGGILCTSTDISDLAPLGRELANRAEQLQYFVDSASDWLWETDENMRFVYLSPNVERIVGVPPDWYYGKTREDLLGDDYDRKAWSEHVQQLHDRKPFQDLVYYRVARGLQPKWLSISGLPVFDEDGEFKGYRGIGRDVSAQKESEIALQRSQAQLNETRATLEQQVTERTSELRHEIGERERAEKALAESERRFRHAFEFAPIGIALLSPEGKRLKLNHALAKFLGSTVDQLRDTSMNTAVTSAEDLQTDHSLRQDVIEGNLTTYHNERSYLRSDGTIVWGEVTGSLVRDENGEPQYFVAHTVDTTERRRNEQLLREANEKLEQRVTERTRKLDAANAALKQENIERKRIEQTLRDSESRFQDFAKSASDWFWETDENHCFKAFLDPQNMLPKARRAQYLGRTRLDSANANLADEQWRQHWADLNAHRPFRNFRYTIIHDGQERHWSINGRPVFDKTNTFLGYRGTGTDITEQVRLERRLAEQSTLLGNILDNLPLHVSLLNLSGRYTFINKYGAEKMGRATADFERKIDEELFGPRDGVTFSGMAMNVMNSGTAIVNETIRPTHWNDSEALLNIVPMTNTEGSISSALVVAQDVTDLSRAQAAIREHEALLNAIVEHIPAFLTMTRASDGVFQLTNERFNRIIGKRKEEIIGRTPVEVNVDPAYKQIISDHTRRVIATRKAITEDRAIADADGLTRMSVTKFPVFDANGEIVSIGSVAIDITEQRKIEEQLHQSQKMEVVGQLTGGIAHDFNNLLGVVIGNLDFLEERLRGQRDLHELVQIATKAAMHGGELTRQLLAFSRRQPLAPKNIDLNFQISQMRDLLRRTLGETVDIGLLNDKNLWHCKADPSQVEAAVLNLAINARDAMPNGGRLILRTANVSFDQADAESELELDAGEYVMLSVTDTGCGMAPEVLKRAFEPFFTTKNVGEGSGLGLSMVFGFAKQSGGHVAIQSTREHGTTVMLYLPRAFATETEEIKDPLQNIPKGMGEHILLVEDDYDLRLLAVAQLKDLGYTVTSASNGHSALDIVLSSGQIDLLVTDVVLPGGMDGVALAAEMTRRYANVKVLFISGYSDYTANQSSAVAEFALLQKPFRKAELARMVQEALAQ